MRRDRLRIAVARSKSIAAGTREPAVTIARPSSAAAREILVPAVVRNFARKPTLFNSHVESRAVVFSNVRGRFGATHERRVVRRENPKTGACTRSVSTRVSLNFRTTSGIRFRVHFYLAFTLTGNGYENDYA